MKKNFWKNNMAITLIALIITVVVMLILAGVAISAVVNSEGLFSKIREAEKTYDNAIKNESEQLQELLEQTDIVPPSVPTVEWSYKKGLVTDNSYMNQIKNIDTAYGRDENGSYTECITTSNEPEIEILNINGITDIYAISIGITELNDDVNCKIYYTENDVYTEENSVSGTILKESTGRRFNIPEGDYKKIKIILGDKAGLIYRFGTIDLKVKSFSGVTNSIIRNYLNSTDNIEVKKYQYSEDKINWYDFEKEMLYREGWNKTIYYRAVDWAGNVSEPTEAYTINIDNEKPIVSIEASNVSSTSFTLKANGEDTKSGIYKYEFYINGVLEKTIQSSENEVVYEVNNKQATTEYKCKVVACDLVGNNATSQEISVTTL